MSATAVADYADQNANFSSIRSFDDFKRWAKANQSGLEQAVIYNATGKAAAWLTDKVLEEAWQILKRRGR